MARDGREDSDARGRVRGVRRRGGIEPPTALARASLGTRPSRDDPDVPSRGRDDEDMARRYEPWAVGNECSGWAVRFAVSDAQRVWSWQASISLLNSIQSAWTRYGVVLFGVVLRAAVAEFVDDVDETPS